MDDDRDSVMINCIKEFGHWARITSTTWCIKAADKTTAEIRDSINAKCPLRSTERLVVFNITSSPWGSYNLSKEVADWLKNNK